MSPRVWCEVGAWPVNATRPAGPQVSIHGDFGTYLFKITRTDVSLRVVFWQVRKTPCRPRS
jgi:hypothetical protein